MNDSVATDVQALQMMATLLAFLRECMTKNEWLK